MEYAMKSVCKDWQNGGNGIVWCHSLGYGILGRCEAKLGRLDEAQKHLIAAADSAKESGYSFLEVIACRDLKAVLPAGSAEAEQIATKMDALSTPLGINCKIEFELLFKTLFLEWP